MNKLRTWAFAACWLVAGMAGAGPVGSQPVMEEPDSPQPHADCYWDGDKWVCNRPATF